MSLYLFVKLLHILSATVLFGTGVGIAFFMVRAHISGNVQEKYFAARTTVLADTLFTTPAIILQPVTGFGLIFWGGFPATMPWLLRSYGLFAIAVICWLVVVILQLKMRSLLAHAVEHDTPPAPAYFRVFRWWFFLGWPALLAFIGIFYFMVFKTV